MASYDKFQNSRIKNSNSADLDKTHKDSSRDKERYFDNRSFEDKVIMWNTFYRRNIHRFIEHYFGIKLHLYQIFFIYLMSLCPLAVIVACRAASKSFIIAVFACAKAVLLPKSMIVIASATKGQSKLIITEKLQKELMPMSPNLRREILDIKTNNNNIEVIFRNGSSIVVVPATDNARG